MAQTWFQDLIFGSSTSIGDQHIVFGDDNRETTAQNLRDMRAYREKRYLDNLKAQETDQSVRKIGRVIHNAVKVSLMSLIIKLGNKVSF